MEFQSSKLAPSERPRSSLNLRGAKVAADDWAIPQPSNLARLEAQDVEVSKHCFSTSAWPIFTWNVHFIIIPPILTIVYGGVAVTSWKLSRKNMEKWWNWCGFTPHGCQTSALWHGSPQDSEDVATPQINLPVLQGLYHHLLVKLE